MSRQLCNVAALDYQYIADSGQHDQLTTANHNNAHFMARPGLSPSDMLSPDEGARATTASGTERKPAHAGGGSRLISAATAGDPRRPPAQEPVAAVPPLPAAQAVPPG